MKVIDQRGAHRFEADLEGQLAGFITYRQAGETLVLLHTEVLPELRGKGLGGRLAGATLDLVRQRGERIRIQCEFLADYVQRHPEYADLLAN
jgi:hypothetical protein